MHRNREFFAGRNKELNRGDQGIFHADQRILILGRRLAFAR
jgi:hypothetical protein